MIRESVYAFLKNAEPWENVPEKFRTWSASPKRKYSCDLPDAFDGDVFLYSEDTETLELIGSCMIEGKKGNLMKPYIIGATCFAGILALLLWAVILGQYTLQTRQLHGYLANKFGPPPDLSKITLKYAPGFDEKNTLRIEFMDTTIHGKTVSYVVKDEDIEALRAKVKAEDAKTTEGVK